MEDFLVLTAGTKTEERELSRDDYVIVLSPEDIRRRGLESHCVVKRKLSFPEYPDATVAFHIHGRILKDKSAVEKTVRMDQTLRNALGLPHGYNHERSPCVVEIFPLKLSYRQSICKHIAYLLGRRYLCMRVVSAHVSEMEKKICRIPAEAFPLLGMDHWGNVVVERPLEPDHGNGCYTLKCVSIKAAPISSEVLKERQQLEKPRWDASSRYPDCSRLLEIRPDIWTVFMDQHLREELGMTSETEATNPALANAERGFCSPIKVRRDLWDIFLNQVLEFGLILCVAFIACLYAVTGPIAQFREDLPKVSASFLGSLGVTLWITLVRLQSKVNGFSIRRALILATCLLLPFALFVAAYYFFPSISELLHHLTRQTVAS